MTFYDETADRRKSMESFLARTREAKRMLAHLSASSRDERIGVEVTAGKDGEISGIEIPDSAMRSSLESIAHAVVAQFNLARAKLAVAMMDATLEAFPGSPDLLRARSAIAGAEREMEIEQSRSNTWGKDQHPPYQRGDDDTGPWRGPVRRP